MKEEITFDDFMKMDIRIGTIISAEKVPETDKLIKLEIDLGNETRTLVAGIAENHETEELIGKQIPILANLKPRKLKGIESQGMILAAVVDDKAILLHPEKKVPNNSEVG